jgi:C1A family cysteine protease
MAEVTLREVHEEIRRHLSRQNREWVAADNPISRLSPEERALRLGAVEPTHSAPFEGEIHHNVGAAPPRSFDYRNIGGQNYVTAIRDQGQCGSCVAFGTLGAMEATISRQKKQNNPTLYLSEADLFFCYGRAAGATCGTGWWPDQALPHCVNPGIVDNGCFPYTDHDQACNRCADWQRRLTKIKSFAKLSSQSAMKDWLYNSGAVVGCFHVYQDFFYYSSGVYRHVTGSLAGGHCVAIIGYDDANQCWSCKNSWGPGWGEHGFFRIAYGQCGIDSWDVLGLD